MKTLTGKVITAPGVKPTIPVAWGRENFWIYGAIEPLTGEHFLHEYPKLNGDYFQEFLDWLSQELGEDYVILQIDSSLLTQVLRFVGLRILFLYFNRLIPPNAHPIERLWELLKQPLKNKLFSSLQDLRNRIQELFDQLTLEQVMSVSSYNFILEALFYAASH